MISYNHHYMFQNCFSNLFQRFQLHVQLLIFALCVFSEQHHTMSRPPIMICDLRVDKNVWKLAIRVVDLWIVKEQNGQQHFEGVIQDSKVCIVVVPAVLK
ncbi:hypothetical protein KIW84_042165 [Lathyrus oleraceus]|uniref:Uncharacterized protein n=1 Tax=Pisum sativum TaxID=3888 RepID=A0A9D4XBQ6_PEA|nr:hypothetical protein KIW84_042165 [Pisum sativum]